MRASYLGALCDIERSEGGGLWASLMKFNCETRCAEEHFFFYFRARKHKQTFCLAHKNDGNLSSACAKIECEDFGQALKYLSERHDYIP